MQVLQESVKHSLITVDIAKIAWVISGTGETDYKGAEGNSSYYWDSKQTGVFPSLFTLQNGLTATGVEAFRLPHDAIFFCTDLSIVGLCEAGVSRWGLYLDPLYVPLVALDSYFQQLAVICSRDFVILDVLFSDFSPGELNSVIGQKCSHFLQGSACTPAFFSNSLLIKSDGERGHCIHL